MLRGLLTRAMFRQALAESQAWTPIESPWTLPTGLLGWALAAVRPASRRTSWLAASEIASPIASGAMPSASAAAAASAACSARPLEDRLAHPVDPGVVGRPRAQRLADQMILVEQLGQEHARLVGLGRVLPVALALDAVKGELGKANEVFIEGKRREREEVLLKKNNFLGWTGSLLLDCLVGYGRIPAFALVWLTFFVILGSFVFREDRMEPQQSETSNHRYNAFLYSLDVFAPIVDFKAKSRWVPKPHKPRLWFYFVIHTIAGSLLLVPIGLAAVTGVFK